ncbi:hypothetical protein [Photobacterium nomapromontoriensis]|uniref:hypothetical protein n=1 Tax=Photobacterium nomapromontoriensis TaxID=2910237 RepID=UPI003D0E7847
MKSLNEMLAQFGLALLPFDEGEREYTRQFIQYRSAFFTQVCTQKADKPQSGLALGLFTQSFQTAFEEFNTTQLKINEMQQLFSQHVATNHADKFTTMNHIEVSVIASLWLLCQGYNGIDYSYANEQATMVSQSLITALAPQQQEALRQKFMHSYYIGIDQARIHAPKTTFIALLKKWWSR